MIYATLFRDLRSLYFKQIILDGNVFQMYLDSGQDCFLNYGHWPVTCNISPNAQHLLSTDPNLLSGLKETDALI